MYITGIGRTPFGKLPNTLTELAIKAAHVALTDADLEAKEIDCVYVSNFCAGPTQKQLHLNSLIVNALEIVGVPSIRIEAACASGGAALHQALTRLDEKKFILVIGLEKLTNDPQQAISGISMASHRDLDQANGLIFPAAYALIADVYMRKYNLTVDDLTSIAFKNHQNANLNHNAHFYNKTVTRDMITNSAIVASPLRLYDCSPLSDGSCALVLTKQKRNKRDVAVVASALRSGPLSLTQMADLTTFSSAVKAAKDAYAMADLSPKDIDLAAVHDCFTIAEAIAMEDLGFCSKGYAKNMIRKNQTSLKGRLPINTDGGLKADGHPIGATGLAQIFELVTQMRGEAGTRQVNNAKYGLSHNIGGTGGTAAVHILKKEMK